MAHSAQHDAATHQLRAYWKPNRQQAHAEHQRALRQWMDSHGLTDISITLFLRGAQHSALRAEAAKALNQ